MPQLHWLKSSFSEEGGNNCVEIAAAGPSAIVLRESERPADVVTADRGALRALVQSLRSLRQVP